MEIMLDIETLGVRPNCCILIIAAIKFNRQKKLGNLPDTDSFYRRIDITSCKNIGMSIDSSTVEWWDTQPDNIRYEALESDGRISIQQALLEFDEWIGNNPNTLVWGNGDDFDCTILGEAYTLCGMEIPWKFWNTRDLRTLYDIAQVKKKDLPKNNKEHHALYDCYYQIKGLHKAFMLLK